MFWIVVAFIAGLAGASVIRRGREQLALAGPKKKKGKRKLLGAGNVSLKQFAEKNGWRLFDGDAKEVQGDSWKLFSLSGPPSLEELYALKALHTIPKESNAALNMVVVSGQAIRGEDWKASVVLRRDTADGPQTLLGATARGGTKVVIGCLATSSTVTPFGLDIVGYDNKVYASGEAPEDLDFSEILAGFSAPLRLRFSEGTLLLRVPGTLTADVAETMVERLTAVRDTMPRRPDLGPQR